MKKNIKSPLNYTGNKYRILNQIEKYFPEKISCMIDLFCGGATVGLNVDADKIIFVDNNERVLNLLEFLSKQDFNAFLSKCEKIIDKYSLSYSYRDGYKYYRLQCSNQNDNNGLKDYNSCGFYRLREDYNNLNDKCSEDANYMLYILMVYAFNNDIRFNREGHFNLPVGKTDLNKSNVYKIKEYIERVKSIDAEFVCASFEEIMDSNLIKSADFIYMDPPYLIGNAVYNSSWNNEKEYRLLDFIEDLIEEEVNFALSNVLSKVGKVNEPLSFWCYRNEEKINVIHIEYNYRSASYNKITRNAKEDEVLIINKRY